MNNRPRVPRPVAVGTAAALMAGLAVAATTAGAPGSTAAQPRDVLQASTTSAITPTAAAPRVPKLSRTPCDGGFQCATARVPLDCQHPDGATISIAVIRHLTTDRAHRAGTLFVNGGGPTPQIRREKTGINRTASDTRTGRLTRGSGGPFHADQRQEIAGQQTAFTPSGAAAPSPRARSGWCPRRSG
jgi:hypothetical protein